MRIPEFPVKLMYPLIGSTLVLIGLHYFFLNPLLKDGNRKHYEFEHKQQVIESIEKRLPRLQKDLAEKKGGLSPDQVKREIAYVLEKLSQRSQVISGLQESRSRLKLIKGFHTGNIIFMILLLLALPLTFNKESALGALKVAGKGGRKIVWILATILFFVAGTGVLKGKNGEYSVTRKTLVLRAVAFFLLVALGWSFLGLTAGNLLRLAHSPLLGFYFFIAILTLAVVLLSVKSFFPKALNRSVECSQCHQAQFLIRDAGSFATSFLLMARCKNCGSLIGPDGFKTETPKLSPGLVVKVLASGIGSALTGAALAFFLTGACWDWIGQKELDKALNELKYAGWVFTVPENQPRIADGENAVYWFQKAGEECRKVNQSLPLNFYQKKNARDFLTMIWDKRNGPLDAEQGRAARSLLSKHKQTLLWSETAAGKKKADWGLDWSRPFYGARMPDYYGIADLGFLLYLKATVEIGQGEPAKAMETARSLFVMAKSFQADSRIFPQSISHSIYQKGLKTAERLLLSLPVSQSQDWLPYLDSEGVLSVLRKTMVMDALAPQEILKTKELQSDFFGRLGFYAPFFKLDLASYYRSILPMLAALQHPPAQAQAEIRDVRKDMERNLWILGRDQWADFDKFYERTLVTVAQMRLAKAAIRIKQYRRKNGSWPDSIWQLVTGQKDEEWRDPFTGGMLRIHRMKEGLVIYSLGPDFIDDQGMPYDAKNKKGDLPWMLKG